MRSNAITLVHMSLSGPRLRGGNAEAEGAVVCLEEASVVRTELLLGHELLHEGNVALLDVGRVIGRGSLAAESQRSLLRAQAPHLRAKARRFVDGLQAAIDVTRCNRCLKVLHGEPRLSHVISTLQREAREQRARTTNLVSPKLRECM